MNGYIRNSQISFFINKACYNVRSNLYWWAFYHTSVFRGKASPMQHRTFLLFTSGTATFDAVGSNKVFIRNTDINMLIRIFKGLRCLTYKDLRFTDVARFIYLAVDDFFRWCFAIGSVNRNVIFSFRLGFCQQIPEN